jgi:hypothetical protein
MPWSFWLTVGLVIGMGQGATAMWFLVRHRWAKPRHYVLRDPIEEEDHQLAQALASVRKRDKTRFQRLVNLHEDDRP